jgi:hypothetical protein
MSQEAFASEGGTVTACVPVLPERVFHLLRLRLWPAKKARPASRRTVQVNPIPSSQCDAEEYRQESPPGELSANQLESAPYSRKAAPTLCWLL